MSSVGRKSKYCGLCLVRFHAPIVSYNREGDTLEGGVEGKPWAESGVNTTSMQWGKLKQWCYEHWLALAMAAAVLVTLIILALTLTIVFSGTSEYSAPYVYKHNPAEASSQYWLKKGNSILTAQLEKKINKNKAKNIIFFLGDGLSFSTVTAARIFEGQREGKSGEENFLFFETLDHTGIARAYCVDSQVADSACSATAYLTGVRGNIGTIGISGETPRTFCGPIKNSTQTTSILEWAQRAGKSTGVVTTTRITHATPAGTYARTSERDWECDTDIIDAKQNPRDCQDIASQLIYNKPGKNIKVLLGGGRIKFLPKNETFHDLKGQRSDGKNLVKEWLRKTKEKGNSTFIWNRSQLLNLDVSSTDYLLGLFSNQHLDYHIDANEVEQPTLAELTQTAIKLLSKNPNGFFLLVEGGKIDLAHHENYAHKALDETVEFAKAIQAADKMTSDVNTLILVTADHSHTMTISGYPPRGNDILSVANNSDLDKLPYATLSYANGPSYRPQVPRHDVSTDNMRDPSYQFPSAVPLTTETHAGEDIPVYVKGPWAHIFSGSYEQSYIPLGLMYASCMGPHLTMCSDEQTKT